MMFYTTDTLEKLMKEFNITQEEVLKLGNLNMITTADKYYKSKWSKIPLKKMLQQLIEEMRCFEN